MSFFKVEPGDVETFTIVTNPYREYISSSTKGVTGSVHVYARRSPIEKEVQPISSFVDSRHNDIDLSSTLRTLQQMGRYANVSGSSASMIATTKSNFPGMVQDYLNKVNAQSISARKQKVLDIVRFTPSFAFTSNTVKKMMIKDQLSSYYRTSYPSAHWAYTNYNCLNFFTSSTVPTSSCLMYPNIAGGQSHSGYVSGTYVPSGAITFDFHINPCYRSEQRDSAFKAGTIFHLSSTYALSLVSGSQKDENGKPAAFRLLLQLSHSADIAPSLALRGTYPNDLVFLSSDNALKFNHWHHVVVRWGTDTINQGTGSFIVDGVNRGTFFVPSGTIAPRSFAAGGPSDPDVLFVGNYFNGWNHGTGSTSYFFAADPALREGIQQLSSLPSVDEPNVARYNLSHPLNAQVHDLAIKRYYMSDLDIKVSASMGPKSIDENWTAFYLPPFFIESSSFRRAVNGVGGILQTPFFEIDGTTNDPFNAALSFGVGGHYINIENYLRDFASNVFPRVHHMSGVAISTTTEAKSANEFLYEQPFVRRRNTFIMPCDDGLFVPSFELLASESIQTNIVDDLGISELSFVNLDNMILSTSLLFYNDFSGSSAFANESIGYTPEQPGLAPGRATLQQKSNVNRSVSSGTFDPGIQEGAPLTIFQRTRDVSSNQVTFFDVSNIFYGKRILPKSLLLKDPSFSGSGGAMSITLKDDGRGTIYRADCLSSASTWNSVGTIFYDEGIIAIKNPHLYFFGKEDYEISFKGEQNIHVLTVNALAPSNHLNSSSNPNFKVVPPSPFPNDPDKQFVYISNINLHDENFNVIMKTQLAQPIMKREGDRISFKLKYDM